MHFTQAVAWDANVVCKPQHIVEGAHTAWKLKIHETFLQPTPLVGWWHTNHSAGPQLVFPGPTQMPQALALSSASQRTAARGVGAVRQSPSVLSRHKAWSTSRPAQPQWQRSSHAMPCSAPRPRGSVAAQAGATIESMVDPFLWANSGVTYAWILLIAAPRWQLTRTIFNSDAVLVSQHVQWCPFVL